ncbi:hypothetical protein [Natrinema halophilum]|uniref:Uncharacterized protein n=1 Tax=Natrinema halophilum TaxID=1699371 RepID=A0A7D5KQ24_9EURY|nr:hypothetical protein [Natrinema halophilum]QLG47897.1 hypothetical protein HYG82_03070 [Natrinema halophilum]
MPTGYCTLEDVRRALQKSQLPGDLSQDKQIAVDAITSQSRWLERTYKRHWYAATGDPILDEATEIDIPTEPRTRDDEHDISTHGAMVHGASERDRHRFRKNSDALLEAGPRYDRCRRDRREPKQEIRIAIGEPEALESPVDEDVPAYTRIRLDRKDVESINELHVINADGGYDDWVAESDYDGGAGLSHRGEDYWGRVNNDGISELYLNVHAMDDDIASLSKAVYVDWDYGTEGISRTVRRAVALFAGAEFTEELSAQVPENAKLYNAETKADEMRDRARKLLEPDQEVP